MWYGGTDGTVGYTDLSMWYGGTDGTVMDTQISLCGMEGQMGLDTQILYTGYRKR